MTITNVLFFAVVALLAHELGHAAAGASFGYRVRPLLNWRGVATGIGRTGQTIPPGRAALIAAAGPAASLLLAATAFLAGEWLLAAMSLELAVLNLLPFPRSDGRNIWRAVREGRAA